MNTKSFTMGAALTLYHRRWIPDSADVDALVTELTGEVLSVLEWPSTDFRALLGARLVGEPLPEGPPDATPEAWVAWAQQVMAARPTVQLGVVAP